MATILTLKGVNFKNDSLPIIAPLIHKGLVGAWRFSNSKNALLDLSGNGEVLTNVGSPTYTSNGIVCTKMDGLSTMLRETKDYTYIAVSRIVQQPTLRDNSCFVVGNYNRKQADNSVTGSGIWKRTDVSNVEVDNVVAQCALQDPFANIVTSHSNTNLTPNKSYEFRFEACVVDTVANFNAIYQPANMSSFQTYSPPQRNFKERPFGETSDYIQIGSTLGVWGPNYVNEISEILIYDRALTIDEINEQYMLSKQYHRTTKGIMI